MKLSSFHKSFVYCWVVKTRSTGETDFCLQGVQQFLRKRERALSEPRPNLSKSIGMVAFERVECLVELYSPSAITRSAQVTEAHKLAACALNAISQEFAQAIDRLIWRLPQISRKVVQSGPQLILVAVLRRKEA